eukprot:gene6497-8932_t
MSSSHVLGVLDLTFLDISEEAEFLNGIALRSNSNNSTITSPTKTTTELQQTTTTLSATNSSSSSKGKRTEVIKAVRLSNNLLSNLDIIPTCLSQSLDLSNIQWLDLSFNGISKMTAAMAEAMPNLMTLHLHANRITKLTEIKKFESFSNLKALTLYGNPVEEHKHYKNFVLYYCTKLTQFDMSPVTKSEIQKMIVFTKTYRKKLHPEEES